MAKFRYESTTLDFTTGIAAPSFPLRPGLSLHSYITNKPAYTITNREHGTTAFVWQSNGAKFTLRQTIEDFWDTTLSKGYYDFTVIDHRYRMLFEASWNDWIETWLRRKGCTYDITYNIESPIPWTPPTFGVYPMTSNNLISHNLNGDDLSTTDGVFVQNATDSEVLRLNGYALKMEGDGSSSGLLGASATVDWSRSTKDNHIALYCQFMTDATLSTGDLAILETTHSSNVFRIELKSSNEAGELTFVNTYNAADDNQGCALDLARLVGFVSTAGVFSPNLKSYKYDTGADFTYVDVSGVNGVGQQVALDVTLMPPLVFSANQINATIHSYNSDANLTHVETSEDVYFPVGVALDTGRGLSFWGNAGNNPALESYPYTGVGLGAQIDTIVLAANTTIRYLSIDTINKLIFGQMSGSANQGLFSFSYDDNGDNLTQKDQADNFTSTWHNGTIVDVSRMIAFHCSDTGLHVYGYDTNGTFTAVLSSITAYDFLNADIDTVNRLIYCAARNDGVRVYRYAPDGTSLTLVDNDDQGGEYTGIAFDSTNGVMITTTPDFNGFHSYSVGTDDNQLFGKIVNNADSTEVRKGASSYHELTNGTWYDLAFSYNAITQKSYLYFAASGDSSFTEFLNGETDISEGIGEYGNADCTVQDIPWTGCNMLKELTNDVVADGSNVYIQNAMVFDGFLGSHDFNTLRRLNYLWNKKSETYPK